jgi:hypothetical protein
MLIGDPEIGTRFGRRQAPRSCPSTPGNAMRIHFVAILFIGASLGGCASFHGITVPQIDLSQYGIPPSLAALAAGNWSYLPLDNTGNGTVAGFNFPITPEALAAYNQSDLALRVLPMLPPGVNVTQYAVLLFGPNATNQVPAPGSPGRGRAASDASAEVGSVGAGYHVIATEAATQLSVTTQTATTGPATTTVPALAGPVSLAINRTVPLHAGDVLKVIVALQTAATSPLAGAAKPGVGAAGARLQDTAVMVVNFAKANAAPAYQTVQQARQAVQAAAAGLAKQGPGTALAALGTAQGLAVPVYAQSLDGIQNVKKVIQSAGIKATVTQTAASLWPAATSQTLSLVTSTLSSGFGIHVGGAVSDAGRLKWTLDANVHGQALQGGADEFGLPSGALPLPSGVPNPAGAAAAAFQVAASGTSTSTLTFTTESSGHDTLGSVAVAGIELGASPAALIQAPVGAVASATGSTVKLPLPAVGDHELTFDGPLGHLTFHV